MTTVEVMSVADVVELVNEWGTQPRGKDGRPRAEGVLSDLADELHPIFAEKSDRAVKITKILDQTAVRPQVADHHGKLIESWIVDDASQDIRASAALALRHHLTSHPGRIGVCADDQCADVYVDASPAGRRRFCCLTCQNRSRAAAFRQRRRAGG
ncbi:CGNR zinc finger domain-containing protein [Actinoplanes sp. TBRC 11911]|uniref:CGNR zinc finger domain-containing protein n=1 Tax=Actinoplanes sp. TBRC 11911 TaxID=2729386 RepID=UPI00145D15BE|nr:CGNR zinc finger domain-containing protein [Actinoplanes sp. TBRC 11911]NMO56205.1 CGNR zinc finger domain-containing protein [Actinoplanes sp. TBRC 11911]